MRGTNLHAPSAEDGTLRVDLRVHNIANQSYRDYLSRYKEFALDPGRNVTMRVSTGI
jgi:iron complex outermembrane receptor protein